MDMTMIPMMLAIDEEAIPLVAIGCGTTIALIAILMGTAKSMSRRKELEVSRREIAAYVAEGSISPEDGERLLRAGPKDDDD